MLGLFIRASPSGDILAPAGVVLWGYELPNYLYPDNLYLGRRRLCPEKDRFNPDKIR